MLKLKRTSQFSFGHVIVSLFIMSIFFAATGRAATTQQLVDITREESDEVIKFVVEVDENSDAKAFYKKSFSAEGELIKKERMKSEMLFQKDGLVLEERKDRIVVTLRSENFAQHNGGHIQIDTLYNGIKGDREQYEVELLREGDQWNLIRKGKKIQSMHIETKKVFLVGAVGVDNIVFK